MLLAVRHEARRFEARRVHLLWLLHQSSAGSGKTSFPGPQFFGSSKRFKVRPPDQTHLVANEESLGDFSVRLVVGRWSFTIESKIVTIRQHGFLARRAVVADCGKLDEPA